jgi:hypothetical protein
MSHFAHVTNGIVDRVIVAEADVIESGLFGPSNEWIQTSYNTLGGIHYAPDSNIPDGGVALRGNYAGVGYIYDSVNDVFYTPRPKDRNGLDCMSWTISAPNWIWTPPITKPNDDNRYLWDEVDKNWIQVTI